MRKKRNWWTFTVLPLYAFTLIFVAGPLVYMIALSFASNREGYGVIWRFTAENYKRLLDPVYLGTFAQSLKLAFSSTAAIMLLGYPFGYFMAKLSSKWKKRMMLFLTIPFWVNSLIRLYGWIIILQTKGTLNGVLLNLGLIETVIQLSGSSHRHDLYTASFYDFICLLQCGEAGLVFDRGGKRSGCQCCPDFFYNHTEADISRTFVRNDSYLYPFHGAVFHSRYSGGK